MALAPRSVCIDASLAGCDPHRFPFFPRKWSEMCCRRSKFSLTGTSGASARLNRFLPDRFILEYKVNGETRRWTALIWPPNLRATLGQAWRQGAGLVSNIPRRRR